MCGVNLQSKCLGVFFGDFYGRVNFSEEMFGGIRGGIFWDKMSRFEGFLLS